MSLITRPLLSGTVKDLKSLKYPLIATPKLDGIRCLIIDGKAVTRKFKPIPNHYIRNHLEASLPDGMDGEIMIKGVTNFNEIQSAVMTFEGEPDFEFHAFDYVAEDLNKPYVDRLKDLEGFVDTWDYDLWGHDYDMDNRFKIVKGVLIPDEAALLHNEQRFLSEGYEGIMLRSINGKYKCGRSTLKEGILLKLKRFQDAEALVIGFHEKMHNDNIQEKDEFGLAKRSHSKDGMIPADTLGALEVRFGAPMGKNVRGMKLVEFKIGSGFDDETRKEIWNNRDKYLGQHVKFKFQELSEELVPRFPVFLGFRHKDDM